MLWGQRYSRQKGQSQSGSGVTRARFFQGDNIEYKDEKGHSVIVEKGKEYYSYTGSKVLIEQTRTEFSKEDLPAPTVIQIAVNKRNKKFYKFT